MPRAMPALMRECRRSAMRGHALYYANSGMTVKAANVFTRPDVIFRFTVRNPLVSDSGPACIASAFPARHCRLARLSCKHACLAQPELLP
jgi:hypothetical protein